jgi:3-dehydroquinate dehydratase/shikimate dehydrogenase
MMSRIVLFPSTAEVDNKGHLIIGGCDTTKLAAEFGCAFAPLDDVRNADAKLLINCTSIGMHPNVEAMPVPPEILKKTMAVFDTVYNPAETLLLKDAKKIKAKTIDGVAMFVNQAMAQFKLFTHHDANAELMRKVVCDRLSFQAEG